MTEVSEAAKVKACELAHAANPSGNSGGLTPRNVVAYDAGRALALYIQAVSDAAKDARARAGLSQLALGIFEPFILHWTVDPLLIEARKIAAAAVTDAPGMHKPEKYLSGELDDEPGIRAVVSALRRGMELAGGQP